ncbi:MAG: SufE family protein [Candidatus Melainabacteria bacterium]|nr:SufE family protein [Candidatus Melainabacteria bacterium]
MESPQTLQQRIVDDFSGCSDWDARYQKIIALGRTLPELPEALKTEENQVKGCQSQVWLAASLNEQQRVYFQADSDAMLVRGLIALLLQVYSDQPPEEILRTEPTFLEAIELTKNLSMQRNNGLAAVLKQIKLYALAFQYQLQNA